VESERFTRFRTIVTTLTISSDRASWPECRNVHGREPNGSHRHDRRGTLIALLTRAGRSIMLMFNRSQMYVAFALAALAEIIVRAVAR
jgi:hypothetical protein